MGRGTIFLEIITNRNNTYPGRFDQGCPTWSKNRLDNFVLLPFSLKFRDTNSTPRFCCSSSEVRCCHLVFAALTLNSILLILLGNPPITWSLSSN